MKNCKCGKTISIMEDYCEECKKRLPLGERFVEDIKNVSYGGSG